MRRFISLLSASALLATVLMASVATVASATNCTPTGFFRDGNNLTAAQIGGNVTGNLDATGCNIGVYYDAAASTGNVTGATIFGANYFGVVVRGAAVNVTNSTVRNIGDVPLTGAQHGLAIYYATVDTGTTCTSGATTGTISANTIHSYQKGGIVANCSGTVVVITDNVVTGASPVSQIAQNGIQLGYHAAGSVSGNLIDGNSYTGSGWVATGLLLFDVSASEIKASQNMYRNNQRNLVLVTEEACPNMFGGFYDTYGLCL